MFNVESDCYLDKRVLRYVTFSIPGFPAFCRAAPRLFSPIHSSPWSVSSAIWVHRVEELG